MLHFEATTAAYVCAATTRENRMVENSRKMGVKLHTMLRPIEGKIPKSAKDKSSVTAVCVLCL